MPDKVIMDEVAFFDRPQEMPYDVIVRAVDLAREMRGCELRIEKLEERISEAKQELRDIKERKLPDAMAEAGVSEFKLPDGTKVAVGDFVSGSLPKDPEKRQEAVKWLEENGAEALFKTNVNVQFGRYQHNLAHDVVAMLEERGFEPVMETGVHASTLAAFARERMRNGEETPFELLGLYAARVAKLTPPRGER